jgi:hypothetical protein
MRLAAIILFSHAPLPNGAATPESKKPNFLSWAFCHCGYG